MSFAEDLQRLWRALVSSVVERVCDQLQDSATAVAREVRSAGADMTHVPKGGLRAVHDELFFKVGLAIRATAPSLQLKGLGEALGEAEAALRIGSSRTPGLLGVAAFGDLPLSATARKLLAEIAQMQRVVWQACCAAQWEQGAYGQSRSDAHFLQAAGRLMPEMRADYLAMVADARLAIAEVVQAAEGAIVLRVPGNLSVVDIADGEAGIEAEDGCMAAVRVTPDGVADLLRPELAAAA